MEHIKIFCPNCWGENDYTCDVCSHCNEPLSQNNTEKYITKLLWALRHPIKEVAVRAAYVLGHIKNKSTINDLIRTFQQADDIFLKKAIISALGQIGTETSYIFLLTLLDDPTFSIRAEALCSLKKLLVGLNTNYRHDLKDKLHKLIIKDTSELVRSLAQKLFQEIDKENNNSF